jgi:hypothetical protein
VFLCTWTHLCKDQYLIFPSFSEKEKPNIKHSFDIWHGAKNLRKKIVKVFLDCTLFYIQLKACVMTYNSAAQFGWSPSQNATCSFNIYR